MSPSCQSGHDPIIRGLSIIRLLSQKCSLEVEESSYVPHHAIFSLSWYLPSERLIRLIFAGSDKIYWYFPAASSSACSALYLKTRLAYACVHLFLHAFASVWHCRGFDRWTNRPYACILTMYLFQILCTQIRPLYRDTSPAICPAYAISYGSYNHRPITSR